MTRLFRITALGGFVLLSLICKPAETAAQQGLKLWYKQPARNWNEALPVGNGRIGAMVFGRVNEELIQLNEETLWSGGPVNNNANPKAFQHLADVRQALENEDYKLAEELTQKIQGPFTESYEPLGDLMIRQEIPGAVSAYRRELDISDAVCTTSFTVDGVAFIREVFVSVPDQVMVVKLKAGKNGALNFTAGMSSQLIYRNEALATNELAMHGQAPSHTDPSYMQTMEIPVVYNDPSRCKGMRFDVRLKVSNTDGQVTTDSTGIHVRNATEAVLLLSAATSFNGYDKCPDKEGKDERLLAGQYLEKSQTRRFDDLKSAHLADYHQFFNRTSLVINGNPMPDKPLDERLKNYAEGAKDPALEALYFSLAATCSYPVRDRAAFRPTFREYGTIR